MKERRVKGAPTPEDEWRSWPGLHALPAITTSDLVAPHKRVIVLAPHPDDEILMVGGFLQQLRRQGNQCLLLAATDGEASHPDSTEWSPERLKTVRPQESTAALQLLEVGTVEIERLNLPDGGLTQSADKLRDILTDVITADDVVITTWALDGHPDHEVCGTLAAVAAEARGATVIEVPVWTWHWAMPADPRVPWHRARRLMLDSEQVQRKQASMSAFRSQLSADVGTGREAVVPPSMIARLSREYEIFFL